jgi:hypothetical protein
VPAGSTVTFRGIKNLDGIIDFMKSKGLDKATEFVVTGGSAGGLRCVCCTHLRAKCGGRCC